MRETNRLDKVEAIMKTAVGNLREGTPPRIDTPRDT